MKVKHCMCKGCGKVHDIPANLSVSKIASPCCSKRMRIIGRSI